MSSTIPRDLKLQSTNAGTCNAPTFYSIYAYQHIPTSTGVLPVTKKSAGKHYPISFPPPPAKSNRGLRLSENMANAHLPNSHPQVTPDWKPWPFTQPSFLGSIETTKLAGFDGNRYSGTVPPAWCASNGRDMAANAGWCLSMLLKTARKYCRDKYGGNVSSDALTAHIDLLAPVPPGLFHVALQSHDAGSRQKLVKAELISPFADKTTVYAAVQIRTGVLEEKIKTESIQPADRPLPDKTKDCGRLVNSAFFYYNPPSASMRYYCPNDGESLLWSPKFGGQSARDQWFKLDDDGLLQLEHIPLIVDLIPDIPYNHLKGGLANSKYWLPSLSLNLHFRSNVKGKEWLLTRTDMRKLHNGRYDLNIQVLDEEGNIVATCVRTSAMIPTRSSKQSSL
ncbi:hypothetical protein S40293_09721 [Stachybotrys chartarum IBT 40293]|nr:hypothetical protein S40293_09721 [Stachybotrys chartarum IBT 40293]